MEIRTTPGTVGCVRVSLAGELDLATAGPVRLRLVELVLHGARHLVVDLGEVTFMDCAGLGSLLAVQRRLESLGEGGLHVVGADGIVRRVLKLTGSGPTLGLAELPAAAAVTG